MRKGKVIQPHLQHGERVNVAADESATLQKSPAEISPQTFSRFAQVSKKALRFLLD
jgi:hypothetical protein